MSETRLVNARAWTHENLATQGYSLTGDEGQRLRVGLRFPTALCLVLVITGLALQSALMVALLVPVGLVAPRRLGETRRTAGADDQDSRTPRLRMIDRICSRDGSCPRGCASAMWACTFETSSCSVCAASSSPQPLQVMAIMRLPSPGSLRVRRLRMPAQGERLNAQIRDEALKLIRGLFMPSEVVMYGER